MKKIYIFIIIIILMLISFLLLFNIKFKISEEEAFQMAFDHIQISKKEIIYKKIKKDTKDHTYHITLKDENYQYKIEISMIGSIVEYERKLLEKENIKTEDKNYISEEEALTIALEYSKLKKEDIFLDKIELEHKKEGPIYEIEFIYNYSEYEYEVDALEGNILKFKIDQ